MDVKKFVAIAAALAMAGVVSLTTAPPDALDNLLSVSAATYLRLESSGDDVKQLQQNLITLNYMQSGSDTGTFDETTDGAVKNLQTEYNLKVDGIVGPETLGLIQGLVDGTAKVIKVDAAKVNIRSGASTGGTIVTTVDKDQKLKYDSYETVGDVKWYKVAVGDKQGYICGSYVSVVELTPLNATTTTTTATTAAEANTTSASNITSGTLRVTGTILNVRSSTSTSSKKLTAVKNGQVFTYSNVKKVNGINWYYIKVDTKTSGWVMGTFISLANSSQASGTLKVTGSILNVRSDASTSSQKITTLKSGQTYTYSNVKNVNGINWYYIKVNASTNGWVMGSYVSLVQTNGTASSPVESGSLKVTGSILNVRSSTSTSSKKLTTLKKGQTYTYSKTKTVSGVKWYYIRVSSKISGWVMGTYVYPTPNTAASTTTTADENSAASTSVATMENGSLKITGSVVNVRSGAGLNNGKITQVKKDETYIYTNKKDGWYYIQLSSTQSGWVMGDYIEATPNTAASTIVSSTTGSSNEAVTTTTAAAVQSGTLKITGTVVNVRSGIGTDSAKVTEVRQGETYTYTDSRNGWYLIKISDTQSGWIMGDYVEATPDATAASTTTTEASDAVTTTTAAAATESGTLKIVGTVVNVRSGAGTENAKITEVKQGKNYAYTDVKDGWYFIHVSSTQSGWVCGDYVEATPLTTTTAATEATQATSSSASSEAVTTTTVAPVQGNNTLRVTGTVVNVRSGAGKGNMKITEVKQGETYTYLDTKDNWYYIQTSSGEGGWICGDYVEIVTATASSATVSSASNVSVTGSASSSAATTTDAPTTRYKESGTLMIASTVVNVRSGPDAGTVKIAEVRYGDVFDYSDKQNGWFCIKLPNSQIGWVMGSYVEYLPFTTTSTYGPYTGTTTSAADPQSGIGSTTVRSQSAVESTTTTQLTTTTTAYKETGTLVIDADALNVRADYLADAKKITEVRQGEVYKYTDYDYGWYYIQLSATKGGWVLGQYVTATPDPTTTTSATTTTTAATTTTTTKATTTTTTEASTTTSSGESTTTEPSGSATTTSSGETETTTQEPTTTTSAATIGRQVVVGTVKVSSTLNVRSGAGTNYPKLGTLKNGATVVIASKGSKWHKIEYGTGYGYVAAEYITNIKTTYENVVLKYPNSYNYVNKGNTLDLGLQVGSASISYTSSDSVRCPISNKGVVTGKTEGLYTITAKSGSAVTTTEVVVLKEPYTDIQAMKISAKGTQFIADWEAGGTILPTGETAFYPYKDVAGYWTIGYGHAKTTAASKSWSEERALAEFNKDIEAMIGAQYTLTDDKPYLSAEGATALLNADLNEGPYVQAVSDWAIRNGVKLNQNQFDALVSFCYNLGPSLWQSDTTKFYLKSSIIAYRSGSNAKADQVIEGFCRYTKASGKNYAGLWYRRRDEAELFLEGDYTRNRSDKFKLPSGTTWY